MSDLFSNFSWSLLIITSLGWAIVTWVYVQRLKKTTKKHEEEQQNQQKILRRQVLELSVMRTLGERVGYSLNLEQILEVIIEAIPELVETSTVSFILKSKEGRYFFKTRVKTPVSYFFLNQVKEQSVKAFMAMTGELIKDDQLEQVVTGEPLEESIEMPVASFFNLPVIINNQVEGMINVSSFEPGLYGDTDTVLLYKIINQVSNQMTMLNRVVENEKGKLTAMVSSLADGILMVDPHYNLIVANKATLSLLGIVKVESLIDVDNAIGSKIDLQGSIKQALAHQTLVKTPEFGLPNGKAIQVDVEPVKDKFNYVLGVVVVLHDATEAKQLDRMKEDFTAMMVHELRTPLTTMVYSTNMILSDFGKIKPEDIKSQVQTISDTTQEMLSLVNELLDIAKIEAGKFQLVKNTEDLSKILTGKLNQFKPIFDQKGLQSILEIDPNLQPFDFDKNRIAQVIDNLLSNSVKYTSSGQINLKAIRRDHHVLVSVADTGEGIAKTDIPKLFSKFEQLGKGKSGDVKGSGLGLVISKGIVEAHGGQIWAESQGLGKGSTFTFSLPLT